MLPRLKMGANQRKHNLPFTYGISNALFHTFKPSVTYEESFKSGLPCSFRWCLVCTQHVSGSQGEDNTENGDDVKTDGGTETANIGCHFFFKRRCTNYRKLLSPLQGRLCDYALLNYWDFWQVSCSALACRSNPAWTCANGMNALAQPVKDSSVKYSVGPPFCCVNR
jgi:hypothetical protein